MSDVSGSISAIRATAVTTLTAAGAGDNTEIVGDIIDRAAYNYPKSIAILVPWDAVLAANKTFTLKTLKLEHGDAANLSDAANYYAPTDVVVATDSGSGSTPKGLQKYGADITGAKRYIRLKVTPDLNNTATDTAKVAPVVILADSFIRPAV